MLTDEVDRQIRSLGFLVFRQSLLAAYSQRIKAKVSLSLMPATKLFKSQTEKLQVHLKSFMA